MGILNITPDSFYDGGQFLNPDDAVNHALHMASQGADIIDIGAASSRPGAPISNPEEELSRLRQVVPGIRQALPDMILSVDTYHSTVAREMVADNEVDIINDISAGDIDSEMIPTIASLRVPYIIMHMQGTPENMQIEPEYENVTDEIIQFFSARIHELQKGGMTDILIDPGFGFGKTLEQNYEILRQLDAFQMFEIPVVAGISRKSMISGLIDSDSASSLNATTAAHMVLLEKGVNIIRVHDVKEASEAITIFNATHA